MPVIKRTVRTYGRHRNRRISTAQKKQPRLLLDSETVRKGSLTEDSLISNLPALTDDDFGCLSSRSSASVSKNKRILRPRGRHRNRRISMTLQEQSDNSSSDPEIAREGQTSPTEHSFFSNRVSPRDDFSRFLSQSLRKYGTKTQFALDTSSSSKSPELFGSVSSDSVLFCSLKKSSNDISDRDSPFPKKLPDQWDVSVSEEEEIKNCKGKRKRKKLKAPRIVKKNTNVVPPSGVKNKTQQIDWNEIENYSLVIEKEVPRASQNTCSPEVLSTAAREKLRSAFCHVPVHKSSVNPSESPFPQIGSTNPSPICNGVGLKENYVFTMCSAENTPEFSKRHSAIQKAVNIKTSTPFVSSAAHHYRPAPSEKTSPLSHKNSSHIKGTTSKITECLAAASECLNKMLRSDHNIVNDQMNGANSLSKSENVMTHSVFFSRTQNSIGGSNPLKDSLLTSDNNVSGVCSFTTSDTSVSEISFLQGKAVKDVSSVGIRESHSLNTNKNFQERFQHMPHSRENSFKVGDSNHKNLIADLRKSAHRMSLSCMKKTSEPSTPVPHHSQTSTLTKAYTSAEWPGVVKPCLIAVTPLKPQAVAPTKKLAYENDDNEKIACTEEDQVLELCSQERPIPFSKAFNPKILQNCKKIGEGVYGEVFRLNHADGIKTALKLIPVEGDFEVNGETQKTFAEILPEIVITKELSNLSGTFHNSTPNFIKIKKVMCLKGKYPSELLQEWDRYNLAKESLNDRPDIYQNKQLFIALECADGGTDLESMQMKNANEAVSIFVQVACTLAIAEQAVQFEHRDLHWGNILVSQCKASEIEYTLNGQDFHISTEGVFASIIDFTLSRLGKDGCVVYTDLSQDPTLFTGEGDYQFDIYRLTKNHNKNNWESFMPYSNVLWLHYLVDKLINEKEYKNKLSKKHKAAKQQLLQWKDTLLQHKSATHFVISSGIVSWKQDFGQNSTDISGKETCAPEVQRKKPLRERKGSMNIALERKAKKGTPSSAAKLKKTSEFIASKKIVPASRTVRGSVRKGKNRIQMTLRAFNVRI